MLLTIHLHRGVLAIVVGCHGEDVTAGGPVSETLAIRGSPPTPPLPCPGNTLLSAVPTGGAMCKDAALRERGVPKISWSVYVTEASSGLCINFILFLFF